MLSVRGLTKQFGSNVSVDAVDLDVRAGEVRGLIGANGSGKTTLLNILFGSPVITQTGGYLGKVLIGGAEVHIRSPAHALSLGIGMIHQEFALIPGMTVAENIKLGRENACGITERLLGRSLAVVRRSLDNRQADHALARLGLAPCARKLVKDLSSSLKPFVEMAREIERGGLRLLLLDEPTSFLGTADAARFGKVLREIAAGGTAVVYVSHRLAEVMAVCDGVTVLRDGRVAGQFERAEFDVNTLAECMTGGDVTQVSKAEDRTFRQVLMKIEDLHVDMQGETLSGASVEIMEGEILGVAGLSGHGRLALGPGIMGTAPASGSVFLEGALLNDRSPASMLAHGICCLPADRSHAGLLPDHSIQENIVFTAVHVRGLFLKSPRMAMLSLVDEHAAREFAERCVERFRIKCRSVRQKVRELSGGNQQKVCLARALAVEPRMLMVAEPTRGVAIEAREVLLQLLVDLNQRSGMTILVASSELDELRRICDRIAVVREGKVSDILGPRDEDCRFMLAFSGKSVPSQ